jgi:hypothetical protein
MSILLFSLVVGIVAGIAAGGRPRFASLRPIRWVVVLLGGVALQLVGVAAGVNETIGLGCLLASYALLVVFALVNIRMVGMPIVLVGLLLNAAVIGANQGMPVRADAIATVDDSRTPAEILALDFDAKRHIEEPDDRLAILGDVVPIEPLRQVVSFGDLILAFGLLNVVFRLLRPHALPRRRERVPASQALVLG